MGYHLKCTINNDPFLDVMDRVQKDLAQLLSNKRDQLKSYPFSVTDFKTQIRRQYDYVAEKPIPNREASLVLNLQHGFLNQTIFTDLKGTIIPWHALSNVYIRFIPYIHIQYIYIGDHRAILNMTLIKGTVLYFGPLIKQARARIPRNPKYQLEYENLLTTLYVSYEDYNNELLAATPPESKTYPNPHYRIPLVYKYHGLFNDFLIESPEVTSNVDGQITIPKGPFIQDLYRGCCHIVSYFKGTLKIPRFDVDQPETTGFPPIFDTPISISLRNKPVFVDTEGLLLSLDCIHNVTMIPLLHIQCIRVQDSIATLQIDIESAIITAYEKT
jgi:hypothetical protein